MISCTRASQVGSKKFGQNKDNNSSLSKSKECEVVHPALQFYQAGGERRRKVMKMCLTGRYFKRSTLTLARVMKAVMTRKKNNCWRARNWGNQGRKAAAEVVGEWSEERREADKQDESRLITKSRESLRAHRNYGAARRHHQMPSTRTR